MNTSQTQRRRNAANTGKSHKFVLQTTISQHWTLLPHCLQWFPCKRSASTLSAASTLCLGVLLEPVVTSCVSEWVNPAGGGGGGLSSGDAPFPPPTSPPPPRPLVPYDLSTLAECCCALARSVLMLSARMLSLSRDVRSAPPPVPPSLPADSFSDASMDFLCMPANENVHMSVGFELKL